MRLLLALAAALLAAAPSATFAQAPTPLHASVHPPARVAAEPPADTSRALPDEAAQIAALQARVEALERAQRNQADALAEAEAAEAREIDVSGEVFTSYGVNTSGTADVRRANSFDLGRFYLTARGRLSERLAFRGTTDVKATEGSSLGYVLFVKYAYFDLAVQPWLTVRTGIQQTGWQNVVTGVWGHRGVAKTLAHEHKYLGMADAGVAALAELPGGYGEAAVAVLNGGGGERLEADAFKDVAARLVVRPFPARAGALAGVQLGVHTYRGTTADGAARDRWGGLVAVKDAGFTAAFNAERRRDGDRVGTGVGAFGRLGLGFAGGLDRFALIGLVDRFSDGGETARGRVVAGLAFTPSRGLTLALDLQRRTGPADAYLRYDGTSTHADTGVFLHATLKY